MASDVRQWFRERFTSGPRPADRYLGRWTTIAFGLLLAVLGFWLFCTLVNLWPTVDRNVQHATTQKSAHLGWGIGTLKLTKSSGLIVLVLLMGAIGGYIHATTSFA